MKTVNLPEVNEAILDAGELRAFLKKVHLLKYFSKNDFKRLNYGRLTSVIKNVHYEGKIWDGSFQLIEEKDGSHILHFKKCNVEIDIPNKVMGKKLSRKDKEALLAGEVVGPFKIGKQDIFLHVDREINTITLYSPERIGIPEEILGYKLSPDERQLLYDGVSIGPKVLCASGHYFAGHFSIDERDDLYLWKIHYDKELTKNEAKELINKYNESQDFNVSDDYGMTARQKQIFFMPPEKEKAPDRINNNEKRNVVGTYTIDSENLYASNKEKIDNNKKIPSPEIIMSSSKSGKTKSSTHDDNLDTSTDTSHVHVVAGVRGLFRDL